MTSSQARLLDMKLEIVVVPLSNVDRAKQFYGDLGWRLDADFRAADGYRVIQFTPPGSGASSSVRISPRRHPVPRTDYI